MTTRIYPDRLLSSFYSHIASSSNTSSNAMNGSRMNGCIYVCLFWRLLVTRCNSDISRLLFLSFQPIHICSTPLARSLHPCDIKHHPISPLPLSAIAGFDWLSNWLIRNHHRKPDSLIINKKSINHEDCPFCPRLSHFDWFLWVCQSPHWQTSFSWRDSCVGGVWQTSVLPSWPGLHREISLRSNLLFVRPVVVLRWVRWRKGLKPDSPKQLRRKRSV